MTVQATTRDIGFVIRDFIEYRSISHFEDDPEFEGELREHEHAREVKFIDAGDPNNLLIHLDNGQRFRVRIFAEG